MFSQIGLFQATNIAVLAILSVSIRVLGVDQMLATEGICMNLIGLLIMAGIMGFAGSFISLALSKFMAKCSMGVQLIKQLLNINGCWLLETVSRQANSFATGINRNNSLVA